MKVEEVTLWGWPWLGLGRMVISFDDAPGLWCSYWTVYLGHSFSINVRWGRYLMRRRDPAAKALRTALAIIRHDARVVTMQPPLSFGDTWRETRERWATELEEEAKLREIEP